MSTKEKVLKILLENKGKSISGEKLAQICDVSRTAIWKAINSLREQNCLIEGTTNGGYVLNSKPDIFSKQNIQSELEKNYLEFSDSHIECFNEIDSTNSYAKRILTECGNLRDSKGNLTEAGKKYHNSIFVAETQTNGKGRLGRNFISPKRTGIYFSIIYAPKGGITQPSKLTAFSAIAVCRTIKKLYNIDAKIKWINDIYINNKKICGILTEGFTNFETGIIESAIIGIGINIENSSEAFKNLENVGFILDSQERENFPTRCELTANVVGETLKVFEENSENLIQEYKNLSCTIGQTVKVHPIINDDSSAYFAKAIDIDNDAALVVQLEDGRIKSLNSGEVTLHNSN